MSWISTHWPTLFIVTLFSLVLLWMAYVCFLLPKRFRVLLRYEESRYFTPFILDELYAENLHYLHWQKLMSFVQVAGHLLLFVLLFFASWPRTLALHTLLRGSPSADVLWPLLFLLQALHLFLLSLHWRHKLHQYYPSSDFYRGTALELHELLEDDADARGYLGEYYAWRLFCTLPEPKQLILSPLIQSKYGFAELDLVLLSTKGIFCIEAKNRLGIFLDNHYLDDRDRWIQVLPKSEKGEVKTKVIDSPIKQNEAHIAALRRLWRMDRRYFFNLVCFGEQADLSQQMHRRSLHQLDHYRNLLYFGQRHKLMTLFEQLPDCLTEETIARLAKELSQKGSFSRKRREALLDERQALFKQRGQSSYRQSHRELNQHFNRSRLQAIKGEASKPKPISKKQAKKSSSQAGAQLASTSAHASSGQKRGRSHTKPATKKQQGHTTTNNRHRSSKPRQK